MRTRIRGWLGDEYDVLRWNDDDGGDPELLDDHGRATRFLRGCLDDTFSKQELRSLYYEENPASRPLSDDELIDQLAWRVAGGDLRIVRHYRIVRHPPPAAKAVEPARPQPQETTTWIEIVLLDDDGEPVTGVTYQLDQAGAGPARSGGLHQNGFARADGLQSARFEASFPDIDADLWEPAG